MGDNYQSLAERWGTERRPGERRKKGAQLTLDQAKTARGGRRKGAGRPKTLRPNVRHRTRDDHNTRIPVHVTMRRAPGLADFRFGRVHDEIVRQIGIAQKDDFRIVHYSIQSDHIHLLIEAEESAFVRGMRSFAIRTAFGLNRGVLKRTGRVWADRYHRHDLRTPTEVRHALVYVLANGTKHGVVPRGQIDPCSSARYFAGWLTPFAAPEGECPVRPAQRWPHGGASWEASVTDDENRPIRNARRWTAGRRAPRDARTLSPLGPPVRWRRPRRAAWPVES